MNILILTPQLPYPPRQGTTIRNYNLIRLLARSHDIDLFTFLAPGERFDGDNRLADICRQVVTAAQPARTTGQRIVDTFTSSRPDMGLRLSSPEAHAALAQLLARQEYDLIQVEGIEMAAYGLAAAERQPQARLIFDDHNAEYLLQKRSALVDLTNPLRWPAAGYSLIQWSKLIHYERMVCSEADAIVAVSEPDRSALVQLVPDRLIDVVPNGIDLAAYADPAPARPAATVPRLVFTGKMDYRPNVDAVLWFAQEVLPLLRQKQPAVCLQVVGMNPHRRLLGLTQEAGIELTGAVADVQPFIDAANVYVAPLRVGGGTRFKILEALASARPIVATSLAVEGLGVQNGRELLIGDEPESFAEAVLRILDDQASGGALSDELTVAGRHFVESHFDWEQIVPRLERVYQAALRSRPLLQQ